MSLPVDFGTVFLSPYLLEFCRRYPSISFEFDLTPRRVDLVAEPFDVAIRMGELPDSQLIARKIAEVPRYLFASQAYLEARGTPKEPEDLSDHDCLLFPKESKWTLRRNGVVKVARVDGRFHLNNVGMMQRLAVAGLGIAMLAKESVIDEQAKEILRPVLPDWQAMPISVHAVTGTRLLPAKTQRFIDYLEECLSRTN